MFRFMDRGGEGTISWIEFKVLDDLWKEIFLGLEEFLFVLQLKITSERLAEEKGFLRGRVVHQGYEDEGKKKKGRTSYLDSVKSALKEDVRREDEKKSRSSRGSGTASMAGTVSMALESETKNATTQILMPSFLGNPTEPVTRFLPKNESFQLATLEDVWSALDSDGGGSISFSEFLLCLQKYQYFRQNNDIVYAFLDADGGEISRDEFLDGFREMMIKTTYSGGSVGKRKDPTPPPISPQAKSKAAAAKAASQN